MVGWSGEGLKNQTFHKNFEGLNKPRKSMAESSENKDNILHDSEQRKLYKTFCQHYEQVDRYKKQEEEEKDISF